VVVREAHDVDLPAIEEVQIAAGRTESLDSVGAAIGDQERFIVVAEVAGAVVGWAKTHRYARPDGAAPAGHYLGGVTVSPAWRRRGVATALTEARMCWIADRTHRAYYLVNAQNRASIALHERWASPRWRGRRRSTG
jgi:ribosomal protein S18 acetylase RimI-like enzyme